MNHSIGKVDSLMGEITLFNLVNDQGSEVTLSTMGAGIVSVIVPDARGEMADVVLGYKSPLNYIDDGPCMGKIPGRYANRIAKGEFELDGKRYHLAINNGPNSLHGGPTGFANRNWHGELVAPNSVVFTYRSADGEEGFPGNLVAKATYVWRNDNTLELYLEATTDAPTVVNLTNHSYFNLNGENSGSALGHTLYLNASRYLPTDSTLVPTGEFAPVKGTPMDFTTAKEVGRDIKADFPALRYGKGYDNCWVIDDWCPGLMQQAAVLASKRSGRQLTIYTTQPGVQVYTGNWLNDSAPSISSGEYHDYDAVAIECQGLPDAPNQPAFPSQVLRPGEVYRQLIFFEFGVMR